MATSKDTDLLGKKNKNPYDPLNETLQWVLFDVISKEPEYKKAIKKKEQISKQNFKLPNRPPFQYLKKINDIYIDTCPKAIPHQIYLFPKRQLLGLKGLLKDLIDLMERAQAVERRRKTAQKRQFAKLKAVKEQADGLAMTQKACYVPINDNIPDTTQLAYG